MSRQNYLTAILTAINLEAPKLAEAFLTMFRKDFPDDGFFKGQAKGPSA